MVDPSRNLLYVLGAALLGIHFTELPEAEKSRLDQAING
jgi:hypothetical protein